MPEFLALDTLVSTAAGGGGVYLAIKTHLWYIRRDVDWIMREIDYLKNPERKS